MQIANTIDAVREQLSQWRQRRQTIAFVPTMGNLHDGHLQLVKQARGLAEKVVVSIFVNPLQFGEGEDFATYPRTLADDSDKLANEGVDLLFAPELAEIYPGGLDIATRVTVPGLSDILCGASRPGHFAGVATIVNKLFNIVQSDTAIFGEKDYQQLAVIKRMVADLAIPMEVIGAAIVREPSGLAMSSRNAYLTEEERQTAPLLYRCLSQACDRIIASESDYPAICEEFTNYLNKNGFNVEYFEIRRQGDLEIPGLDDTSLVILVAARLGSTRLIDNIQLSLAGESAR
jgi:pantoate--beta-alanine ligase